MNQRERHTDTKPEFPDDPWPSDAEIAARADAAALAVCKATDPGVRLGRVLDTLAGLAAWADTALNNEAADRQYIAEYLSEALFALADGGQPAPPPF